VLTCQIIAMTCSCIWYFEQLTCVLHKSSRYFCLLWNNHHSEILTFKKMFHSYIICNLSYTTNSRCVYDYRYIYTLLVGELSHFCIFFLDISFSLFWCLTCMKKITYMYFDDKSLNYSKYISHLKIDIL
jgi:hypothetical protein